MHLIVEIVEIVEAFEAWRHDVTAGDRRAKPDHELLQLKHEQKPRE
jgi:hypothetical protein